MLFRSTEPVVWLDALDLPLIHDMETSYRTDGAWEAPANRPDSSRTAYRRAGLLPYGALDRRAGDYPLLRFPWREVREALTAFAGACGPDDSVRLAYVNPETGAECLATMGFSALMLRPGETLTMARRSASAVAHVIEGAGAGVVDGVTIDWSEADTFAVPTHAEVTLRNASNGAPAFLFLVDDAPLQRRLGIYEAFCDDR